MNIYQAILKAADKIAHEPSSFRFMCTNVPHACRTPGCALGWIGFYAGHAPGTSFAQVATDQMGLGQLPINWYKLPERERGREFTFYSRMEDLAPGWINDALICATGLRLYAAKYHAPKHVGLPDVVREIFTNPAKVSADAFH